MIRFVLWMLGFSGLSDRDIFRFWDGRRWRKADPFVIARVLFTHPKFDWDETPVSLTMARVEPQLAAVETMALAVREAFGIKAFEQGGLTESECLDLLYEFREYMGHVKKNGSLFPISPPSTDSPPSVSSDAASSTSADSDSGSIPVDNSTAMPGPSLREPSPLTTETASTSAAPSTRTTNEAG